jgi:cell division protease FtsH
MNISIWKNKFNLLLSILLLPLISSQALAIDPMDGITQEQIDEVRNLWEGQLSAIKDQFTRVDLNLQDLALMVNHDKIKTVESKHALIEEIKAIRSIIDSIQKDPFIHVDPATNVKLIHILNGIVDHVKKAVDQNMATFAPFPAEEVFKRVGDLEMDFEKINFEDDLAVLTKNIEDFESASKNIGLAWYNKVYRKFNDAVIQPSIKHNVVGNVGTAVAVTSMAWYLLWFNSNRGTRPENQAPFPPEGDANRINTPEDVQRIQHYANSEHKKEVYYEWEYWLRDKVGAYPHVNNVQLEYTDPLNHHYKGKNPLGILGNTQLKVWQFFHTQMPLATVALPYLTPILKEKADQSYGWLSRKTVEMHNSLMGGVYSQKAHESANKHKSTLTFNDLVGLAYPKQELSMILRYMEDPERWDRSGTGIERFILMTGPTRTGKSYIARALAGEISKILEKQNRNPDEFGFYEVNASMIKQATITGLLEYAKTIAPCVLFIDEIDLLRLQRSTDADLLADFLTALSGMNSGDAKRQVFILAATNKPENMDAALKQPGRFGKEIRFEYPNFSERKEFLLKRLEALAIDTDELNIDKLVYETAGISYEALNVLIRGAFQKAKIHRRILDQELLEESLDSEIRQIRTKDAKNIPIEQRQIIAAHQAGHVLATMLLPTGHKVAKVTILPVQNRLEEELIWEKVKKDDTQIPIENGKMFTYSKHDTLNVHGKQQKLNICKIHLAGHIAEEVLLGECGYSYHVTDCPKGCSDKEKAYPFAVSLVAQGLRPDEKTSKKIRDKIDADAHQLFEESNKQLRELFEQHKETLQAIAQALQEKMTLTGAEIEAIIAKTSPALAQAVSAEPVVAAPAVDANTVEKALGIKEELPA